MHVDKVHLLPTRASFSGAPASLCSGRLDAEIHKKKDEDYNHITASAVLRTQGFFNASFPKTTKG
jgi:hypothetical protein